ncbi:Uncharacterised protein [Mycobacterium tuberculosis]|nr:Uncharacterised protein [Mycobacterium tuberculosis]CNU22316.1 Uncharacterised protein [Mycobacterium tuberculosis]CNW76074.1 Uncharacterised protein [Mycobacterium tuberculosis]CNW97816.1 Uncharacterised protein [Mycobacterium tuberculosis]COW15747.1 Uncharacterised protein [Mycobacterium tuberculosis]
MMFGRTDTAKRGDPDGHRHVHLTAGASPVLGQMAHHLVESRIGKAVELDFWHRHKAT